ncbi:MAG TPA: hypothetical protein VME17_04980 [Bryobacteraceae bacterium]|nr:hypothetical protein [Bryobacteraceae bacterium]
MAAYPIMEDRPIGGRIVRRRATFLLTPEETEDRKPRLRESHQKPWDWQQWNILIATYLLPFLISLVYQIGVIAGFLLTYWAVSRLFHFFMK